MADEPETPVAMVLPAVVKPPLSRFID